MAGAAPPLAQPIRVTLIERALQKLRAVREHGRLEHDFARLVATASTPSGSGPKVGIATFGSGGWHFVVEALLAHALAARGARPEFLMCDLPDLPICDERTIHSRSRERCDGCLEDKRALLDACRLSWRGTSELVSSSSLARARTTTATLAADAIAAYVERGWPVGQWLHVSACHYLRCDARGESTEKLDVHRRLLATAIVTVEAVERWLDEVRPEIVIAESGAHLMWRIALELARARGIPVVCREMGKGGWDSHLYALNADCMAPDLSAEWTEAEGQRLSAEEEAAVDRLFDELPARTYLQRAPVVRSGPAELRERLGIAPAARVAVAFTNVTWDLATAGRDVAFDGVFDWLRDTIRTLSAHPAVHLIVRAHPAEASVLTRERILDQIAHEWPNGLAQVTLVPPEDTTAARDLCAIADLVLAYNSTVAIEAAADGHAVVVSGAPHYRGRGFTIDVASCEHYHSVLNGWAAGTPIEAPTAAATLARRYAHLFFLRYHVPMSWTTSPLEPPYHLRIRSTRELEPGVNPVLDAVCQGILEHRQVVLPRVSVGEQS